MPEPPSSVLPESPAVSEQIPGTGIDATDATVAALRAALAAGAVTARGLTAFYLSRIERLDPLLHSVISLSGDALAEAQAIDEALASGAAARPLEGIPRTAMLSLIRTGMPSSGRAAAPPARASSLAWASASASPLTLMTECSRGSRRSIRLR